MTDAMMPRPGWTAEADGIATPMQLTEDEFRHLLTAGKVTLECPRCDHPERTGPAVGQHPGQQPATGEHRIRWYAYIRHDDGRRELIPKTSTMRGMWAWEARCSCGRETRTGGATRSHLEQLIWEHKHGFNDWHPLEVAR